MTEDELKVALAAALIAAKPYGVVIDHLFLTEEGRPTLRAFYRRKHVGTASLLASGKWHTTKMQRGRGTVLAQAWVETVEDAVRFMSTDVNGKAMNGG